MKWKNGMKEQMMELRWIRMRIKNLKIRNKSNGKLYNILETQSNNGIASD